LDISNNTILISDFKNFFSYACFFASLSEEWIDRTNLNRDEVSQDFVDFLKETPELGLKLIRIAPDGLPKEKFANGIVEALIALREAWLPWLESKASMELPAEARTQILYAQLEVCRKFVEIEPELRRVGLMNAIDLSEIQLDEAARLRVRVEGKAFDKEDEQGDIGQPETNGANEVKPHTLIGIKDAYLTHIEIARMHEVNSESLRKRLDRFRLSNFDDWHEVNNPKRNEPKYLYSYEAVKKIALSLKASGDSSAERPTK